MSLKNTRVLTKEISVSNVREHISQLLIALGYVQNNEDVTSMTLGSGSKRFELDGLGTGVIPITLYIKKHREVRINKFNG